ncbi:MAG: hypothetical protein HYR83_08570 [Planctomycetes bacterium]|nr:hypothetical protein [Planctomycetota bacterium]
MFVRRNTIAAGATILSLILSMRTQAAPAVSSDGVWRDDDRALAVSSVGKEIWIQPDQFRAVVLNRDNLQALLNTAPLEFSQRPAAIFQLPKPDGGFSQFKIQESPIMEPGLAAKFPEIHTFIGQGIDDPAASLRMDWTPLGFHAQVLVPNDGTYYIDPRFRGDTESYSSYFKRDYRIGAKVVCDTAPGPTPWLDQARQTNALLTTGDTLRTYRLAVGATGEFTAFYGGTVPGAMAGIVTIVNRVTGVYENDVAIRLVLVANNDLIVYTNAATDPYSNNDGATMLTQNQSVCSTVIGNANYDIGHAFSTGGGGIARLGAVCVNSIKAQGVTGSSAPTGDAYSIDYVAHEMGHEFGGNHPFNSSTSNCGGGNRNGSTAYEPGSGSTIMAYAGICGADDLQPHSDPYFHTVSFDEIRSYVTVGSGRTCPVATSTGNSDPTVSAGGDYSIPKSTPFILTATGSDPDGDAVTYCWEQRDLGPSTTLAASDNGTSPIIRSFNPTTDPSRMIPRLSNLLNNTFAVGEKLPSVNRTMDFRVMIRDNHAGGGGVSFDNMVANVVAAAGPFVVTFPNSAMTLYGPQTVTWNVAGTDLAPISTSNVNILLSTDGGNTWPITLAANTPNDGSELVILPDTPTTTARIKVEAVGNIFFDISNADFTIAACPAASAAQAEASPVLKNRYIALVPQNTGVPTSLQVVLANLPPPFDSHNGEVRWVGPPQSYTDEAHGNSFWAATLQCQPYMQDWGSIGTLYVYGREIIPDATYQVSAAICDVNNPGHFSSPLSIGTSIWGDVVAPFGGAQPDISDIAAVVDAFRDLPTAVVKPRAELNGDSVNPGTPVNISEVANAVNAFRGLPYSFAGPGTCP